MRKVLLVLPTSWDVKQLELVEASWSSRFELIFDDTEDAELAWDFDPIAHANALIARHRGAIDGVFSSSDYPGATIAAAIATELGLPGSRPEAVLRASHKYHSRIEQAAAVPEATPAFELIDLDRPRAPDLPFPLFVKPVKGAYSMFARRVDDAGDLSRFLGQPELREYCDYYLDMFDRSVAHWTDLSHRRGWMIAEELLSGDQVTVEGFVKGDAIEIFGVVDSFMHPGTHSFRRFDYPSLLPLEVQERMSDLATRIVRKLALGDGLFNLEMIWDRVRDRVSIIEINPRICGQFADLYLAVDGASTFELALELATGTEPAFPRRNGRHGCASSFPLRIFEPMSVERSPSAEEVRAIEGRHPGALIWNECATGDRLDDFVSLEDGASHRYAVINLGARDRAELEERFRRVCAELAFELRPLSRGA